MKKFFIVLLLLGVASSAWASNDWLTNAASSDWFTATNWSSGVVPSRSVATNARLYQTHMNTTYMPIINSGAAESYQLEVGGDSQALIPGNKGRLTMNGGTLTTGGTTGTNGGYLRAGASSTSNRWGEIYMNGGTINVGGVEPFTIGWGGGTVDIRGWLYMTGGTINVTNKFIIGNAAGASGYVDMSGGTINAGDFQMKVTAGTGTVSLTMSGSAEIIITGDKTGLVQQYMDNGWINEEVQYDFDVSNAGKTTLFIPEPATLCLLGIGALSLLRRRK
jgi:hypothetical protein